MFANPVFRHARALAVLTALIGTLSGCVPGEFGTAQVAQSRTKLANGALTVTAPKGWCIDPKSLRDSGAGGFALFGNCAAISRNPDDAHAPLPALLSVTVGPPAVTDASGTFGKDRLAKIGTFFRSELGRAALARSGEAGDVTIDKSEISGDVLMLRVTDRSKQGGPPVADTYLRGISDIGGRIVALSVMPLKDGEMSYDAQRRLLREFVAAIRAAN